MGHLLRRRSLNHKRGIFVVSGRGHLRNYVVKQGSADFQDRSSLLKVAKTLKKSCRLPPVAPFFKKSPMMP